MPFFDPNLIFGNMSAVNPVNTSVPNLPKYNLPTSPNVAPANFTIPQPPPLSYQAPLMSQPNFDFSSSTTDNEEDPAAQFADASKNLVNAASGGYLFIPPTKISPDAPEDQKMRDLFNSTMAQLDSLKGQMNSKDLSENRKKLQDQLSELIKPGQNEVDALNSLQNALKNAPIQKPLATPRDFFFDDKNKLTQQGGLTLLASALAPFLSPNAQIYAQNSAAPAAISNQYATTQNAVNAQDFQNNLQKWQNGITGLQQSLNAYQQQRNLGLQAAQYNLSSFDKITQDQFKQMDSLTKTAKDIYDSISSDDTKTDEDKKNALGSIQKLYAQLDPTQIKTQADADYIINQINAIGKPYGIEYRGKFPVGLSGQTEFATTQKAKVAEAKQKEASMQLSMTNLKIKQAELAHLPDKYKIEAAKANAFLQNIADSKAARWARIGISKQNAANLGKLSALQRIVLTRDIKLTDSFVKQAADIDKKIASKTSMKSKAAGLGIPLGNIDKEIADLQNQKKKVLGQAKSQVNRLNQQYPAAGGGFQLPTDIGEDGTEE